MRRRLAPAVAAALALAATLALTGIGSPAAGAEPGAQAATDCVLVHHKKRIVKRRVIHRNGKRIVRRRVRIKRWTTCEPVANQTPATLGVPAYDTNDAACQGNEMCLQPTRPSVPAGPVTVELSNRGQDAHTLRLVKVGGSDPPFSIPADLGAEVPPGTSQRRTFTLTAGTWSLFCSLAGHEAAGMQATLTVD